MGLRGARGWRCPRNHDRQSSVSPAALGCEAPVVVAQGTRSSGQRRATECHQRLGGSPAPWEQMALLPAGPAQASGPEGVDQRQQSTTRLAGTRERWQARPPPAPGHSLVQQSPTPWHQGPVLP